MNKHIFLSYSHQDGDSMHQLREDLTTLGATIWTDERLVIGTPSWKKAVEQALDDAIAVVVLLSPSAKVSIWVEEEVNYAKLHEIPILPVLIRGEEIDAIPFGLTGAQLIDLRNSNTYLENLKRLKQAILSMRSRAQRGESPHDAMDRVETSTAQTYSQHSYRREVADILSYYTQVFVGRGEEVSLIEAFGAQEQPGYLLLEAPSGYGKSMILPRNWTIPYVKEARGTEPKGNATDGHAANGNRAHDWPTTTAA